MTKRKSKNEWIAAVYGTGGIIGEIARRLGVTSRAVTKRKAADEEFREAIEQEQSEITTYAESAVVKAIKEGKNFKVIMWYLDRKAKDQGYGNNVKVEATVEGDGQGSVVIVLPDNGRDGYVSGSGNGTGNGTNKSS